MVSIRTKIFEGYIDDIASFTDRAYKEKSVTRFYKNFDDNEFRPRSKTVIIAFPQKKNFHKFLTNFKLEKQIQIFQKESLTMEEKLKKYEKKRQKLLDVHLGKKSG